MMSIPYPKIIHKGDSVELTPEAACDIDVLLLLFASSSKVLVALIPTTTKKATATSKITKPLDPILQNI